MEEIKELGRSFGCSLLIVSHDVAVIAKMCDTVAVMYGGRIVESGPIRSVFKRPYHPYTLGLLNAFPTPRGEKKVLISIPGTPPSLLRPPVGCRFADRCPFAQPLCREADPPELYVDAEHRVFCHRSDAIDEIRARAALEETWTESLS